jgi:hypothetical protein
MVLGGMKKSSRILASGILGFCVLIGLVLVMSNLANLDFDLEASPEKLTFEFTDPDMECQIYSELKLGLNNAIANGKVCSMNEECTLLSKFSREAVAVASLETVRTKRDALNSFTPVIPCEPISYTRPPVPAANPAALCIEGQCVYRDLGLPPGV